MAALVIHEIDEEIVEALEGVAEQNGTSPKIEHRRILEAALKPAEPQKKCFVEFLASMPNIGKDEDFGC
ncbi:FitA-like ribbon-helix-helix domain-containing protein [Spartinivicinus poritis]|uniref:Antitoxin FitA-like ribbon-helix-helix domain-containing protein n=1 Tax=Spartinivicinus poritis TaxID=2994640 RepID=A0ABT5U5R1_9GAMM|nr:hypothetical protein [Spartinivicinus sp. A2-2]MDE1461695.1 hypothetical protein [Spartinivicinus sp. A2-2]